MTRCLQTSKMNLLNISMISKNLNFSISRRYSKFDNLVDIQLIGFSAAPEKAYAICCLSKVVRHEW